jgi:hypothetical protein
MEHVEIKTDMKPQSSQGNSRFALKQKKQNEK